MNTVMAVYRRAVFEPRQEYAIEYVEYILHTFLDAVGMTTEDFVHGKGKRKTFNQRLYEKVYDCYKKLKSYAQKITICGEDRNSYSKTDNDATFIVRTICWTMANCPKAPRKQFLLLSVLLSLTICSLRAVA